MRIAPELVEAQPQNLDRHLSGLIQQPHLTRDWIGHALLQTSVTPSVRAGTAVDPKLVDAGRYVDILFAGFNGVSSYSSPESLQAGVQDRRMELIRAELSIRRFRNPHFTQHIPVVSPQLRNALEKRAVLNTAFAKTRVV